MSSSSSNTAIRLVASLTLFVLGPVMFGGCSWAPIRATSSLAPAVQSDTIGYNDAVGDASDRILLTNILRAKNFAPLNLSQLSSISGALSLQGTLGFTVPYGNGVSGMGPMNAQNIAMPSVTGSTTPTYTVSPLNTQGFTLNILQPISSAYVLNRWQAGLPRELLLLLFVKEIDFPVLAGKKVVGTRRFINDPDNEARFNAFENLIGVLLDAGVQLKALDIMDPVGPPFGLYAISGQGSSPTTTLNADQTGFGQITAANDGQYHVGNISTQASTSQKAIDQGGQLYRVYSGQVEVCINHTADTAKYGLDPPDISPAVPTASTPQKLTLRDAGRNFTDEELKIFKIQQTNGLLGVLTAGANPSAGTGTNASGPSATPGSKAGAAAPASSSGQGMTAALQAGRVSALVDASGCHGDQIVLNPFTEVDFQNASEFFVHVQWRSVSEVFDYLGATLRYNDRNTAMRLAWTDPAEQDSTIEHRKSIGSLEKDLDPPTAPAPKTPTAQERPAKPLGAIVFMADKAGTGDISASYNGKSIAPDKVDPKNPDKDNTMLILSMLSMLVDYSSQPSAISTSAPLRLLPIP